jgi:primase-polymerase (primpol)-like protein
VGDILDPIAKRYLGWKWELPKDRQKWTKPPLFVTDQGEVRNASTTDPSTWLTLEQAWLGWSMGQFDGIGIELLDEPVGLRRIDLDGVRNPATGAITAEARAIVDNCNSLTTLSVSGSGLALWIWGPPFGDRHSYKVNRPDWPRVCDKDPAIEYLSSHCYSCLGLVLP